jgi:hypothetical protein
MSTSAAESQQPPGQVAPEQVSTLPLVTTQRPSPAEMKEDARWTIARRLVLAYVIFLAFSLAIPMVLLWSPRVNNGFSVSDARDLMLAMSGTLSGLVGILGFVMGYYFKELDRASEAATARSKKG